MKIFIQHNESGSYLQSYGQWTANRERARSFETSLEAMDFCGQKGIRDAHLRFCFSDPQFDFSIHPFRPRQQRVGVRRNRNGRWGAQRGRGTRPRVANGSGRGGTVEEWPVPVQVSGQASPLFT